MLLGNGVLVYKRKQSEQKQKVRWPLWHFANLGETDPQIPGLCPRNQLLCDLI